MVPTTRGSVSSLVATSNVEKSSSSSKNKEVVQMFAEEEYLSGSVSSPRLPGSPRLEKPL